MAGKMTLTAETVREHFDYDPETGIVRWRKPTAGHIRAGDIAGGITMGGYKETCFRGSVIGAHRIAWLHLHGGELPEVIDHINGNPSDNRIANLRASTHQLNLQNQRRARADNKHSGLLGAAFHKASGRYRARIGMPDGRQKHLGLFDTAEQAHAAYIAAKRIYHAACTV
jgi:hypothetical protein